jgi:hypothetical protein
MKITVTVECDEEDGSPVDREVKTIGPGDYIIIVADPCHVAHTNKYGNGTHVITIKDGPTAAV